MISAQQLSRAKTSIFFYCLLYRLNPGICGGVLQRKIVSIRSSVVKHLWIKKRTLTKCPESGDHNKVRMDMSRPVLLLPLVRTGLSDAREMSAQHLLRPHRWAACTFWLRIKWLNYLAQIALWDHCPNSARNYPGAMACGNIQTYSRQGFLAACRLSLDSLSARSL
jgi:hypothetical protein